MLSSSARFSPVRRTRRRAGFTLIEVALALIVFLMMTLMFAAVFPIAVRAAQFSNNYSQAAQIAQRKIDQLRGAGYDKLNYADLRTLGIVDAQANPPTAYPLVLPFTSVETLVRTGAGNGFFAAGSTGTITIDDYHNDSADGASATNTAAGNMMFVTVNISWQDGGLSPGSYTTSALLIRMVHK